MLIGLFGAAGAVARYACSGWALRILGTGFPYGTLVVNVLGCFLLGLLTRYGQASTAIPDHWRTGLQIGLLGAFTTFSTFGYETLMQLENGDWRGAMLNVAANVLVGLAAVWLGVYVARFLIGGN